MVTKVTLLLWRVSLDESRMKFTVLIKICIFIFFSLWHICWSKSHNPGLANVVDTFCKLEFAFRRISRSHQPEVDQREILTGDGYNWKKVQCRNAK